MDGAEVRDVVRRLRQFGGEPADVEVKAAVGGLPKRVVETVSAFSNTNGGLIVLGVAEKAGFTPVRLPDPVKLRDDLVSAASDQLVPPSVRALSWSRSTVPCSSWPRSRPCHCQSGTTSLRRRTGSGGSSRKSR
ncbi:MAG: AlbA family DNA-binding domain-containing protein [Pseudonocardiaceae bacterium]